MCSVHLHLACKAVATRAPGSWPLSFVHKVFSRLPTRSQHASEAPITRQWLWIRNACHTCPGTRPSRRGHPSLDKWGRRSKLALTAPQSVRERTTTTRTSRPSKAGKPKTAVQPGAPWHTHRFTRPGKACMVRSPVHSCHGHPTRSKSLRGGGAYSRATDRLLENAKWSTATQVQKSKT